MEGYVIVNEKGHSLAKGLWWVSFNEDAYVHPAVTIPYIKEKFKMAKNQVAVGSSWSEPTKKIPATWTAEDGLSITGPSEKW